MRKEIKLPFGPGIEVEEIELRDGRWVLSARAAGERSCPSVATFRRLGMIGIIDVCRIFLFRERRSCSTCVWDSGDASTNGAAARHSWNACLRLRLPWRAVPSGSQRSSGCSDTLQGGLPSERLLARLAMPVSDNAILRRLKRHVRECADPAPLRTWRRIESSSIC